jgi:ESS family glutamate:Na+ symporter
MEFDNGVLQFSAFFAVTLGIIVLFVGRRVNNAVGFLKEFSIPEPVTGGLIFSLLITLLYLLGDVEIHFDLAARDVLLVYFFTTIGINASLKDLLSGGKPLVLLLTVTIAYMFLQNLTGITVASLFDQPAAVGMLGGTVSLIGGHGTAIAWAPRIAEDYGISNAMEIGIACATFGLILAIHISAIVGFLINSGLEDIGLKLPLFVTCLFAGILITNLIPKSYPRISGVAWPSRKPAIALIAEVSLGTFLAMSLMSMQLWTLVDLAGPIITILGAQLLIAICVTLFVVFPLMGRNYDATVVCAGFGGISLGSTPRPPRLICRR